MNNTKRKKLNVAVVGAGFISEYHVKGINATDDAVVSLLVGRDEKKTAARARELGVEHIETNFTAALSGSSVDAVIIATPDATHRQTAIAALVSGKPTLLQKPMALNLEECNEIIATQKQTGTALSISFMHRYFPEVRWLKHLLDANSLGQVQSVRIRNATPGADWADWFYTRGQVSGGVVMQLGVHGIDLCQYLFGPIETVSAMTTTVRPEKTLSDGRTVRSSVEDNALAHYTLKSGAAVTHEMSYTELAGCDRFRLELYTDQGSVWLRSERGLAAMFAPGITGKEHWNVPDLAVEPFGKLHHEHWLESFISGVDDQTAAAGASTINVAETLYRSASSGSVKRVAR